MKKKVFSVVVIMFLFISSFSQDWVKDDSDNFSLKGVVDADSLLADKIFDISRMWFAETFNDADEVIDYENKKNHTLIGNGIISVFHSSGLANLKLYVKFKVKIQAKDNKYRYCIDNIYYNGVPISTYYGYQYKNNGTKRTGNIYTCYGETIEKTRIELCNLMESLNNEIVNSNIDDNDW